MADLSELVVWEPLPTGEVRVQLIDYVRGWSGVVAGQLLAFSLVVSVFAFGGSSFWGTVAMGLGFTVGIFLPSWLEKRIDHRKPNTEALLRVAGERWTAVFVESLNFPGIKHGEGFIVHFREDGVEIRGSKKRTFLAKDGAVSVKLSQRKRTSVLRIGPEIGGIQFAVRDNGLLVQRAYEGRFLELEG